MTWTVAGGAADEEDERGKFGEAHLFDIRLVFGTAVFVRSSGIAAKAMDR